MSQKFLEINYGINFGVLPEAPANPKEGDIYFNDTDKTLKAYSGSSWAQLTKYLGPLSEEPVSGSSGQTYFNTATSAYRAYINGKWLTLHQGETYLGLKTDPFIEVSLSSGTKVSLTLQSSASTIKFTGGVPGQKYVVRIFFSDLMSPGCIVDFHPSVLFDKSYAAPISPEANGQAVVRITPGADGFYYASVDSLPSSLATDVTALQGRTHSTFNDEIRGYYLMKGDALYAWYQRDTFNYLKIDGDTSEDYLSDPKKSWPFAVKMAQITQRCILVLEKSTGYIWGQGDFEDGDGYNTPFQLPGINLLQSNSPLRMAGAVSYSHISSDLYGTLAIEGSTGLAWAWGVHQNGRLGINQGANGTTIDSRYAISPISVAGGRSYSKISKGYRNSYFLEGSTGYIYATGMQTALGISAAAAVSSPILVQGGRSYTSVVASTTDQYVYAIEGSTGFIWAWGQNSGRLGDGTSTAKSTPTLIATAKSFDQVCSIDYGGIAREASTGQVYFWGRASGYGNYDSQIFKDAGVSGIQNYTTSPVILYKKSASKIGAGLWKIFIQDGFTGKVHTYPYDFSNYPGCGNRYDYRLREKPQLLLKTAGLYKKNFLIDTTKGRVAVPIEVSTGYVYSRGGYTVPVLGNRSFSEAAINTTFDMVSGIEASTGLVWLSRYPSPNTPTPVPLPGPMKNIQGGYCAIEASTGYAWTWDVSGSPRSTLGSRSFSKVAYLYPTTAAIEASTGFAWAWSLLGTVYLGDGTSVASSSPVSVLGGRSFKQVAIVGSTFAGLEASTGIVWTWGQDSNGSLGTNNSVHSSPMSVLGGRSYKSLRDLHTLFIAEEGSTGALYMWGYNRFFSDLSSGVSPYQVISSPTLLPLPKGRSLSNLTFFGNSSTSGDTALAQDAITGEYYCWGNISLFDENPLVRDYLTIPVKNEPDT